MTVKDSGDGARGRQSLFTLILQKTTDLALSPLSISGRTMPLVTEKVLPMSLVHLLPMSPVYTGRESVRDASNIFSVDFSANGSGFKPAPAFHSFFCSLIISLTSLKIGSMS